MRGDPLVQPAGEAVVADGAAPVKVPDGFSIFTAQFARAGEDLLLTSADGKSLTVVDYFNASQPPALVAPNGAMLMGDVVGHLAGPRAPGQFAQDGEPELGESIGRVETLTGTATATRATGETVELRPGQPVFEGDVIETGADTDLAIQIVDGTLASMSSDSRLILDELVYEPGGSANSMLVSLVEGAFAFITGAVAGSGGMDIQTPVAVMAIRGTVPIAVVSQEGTNFFAGSDSTYELLHLVTGELIAEISSGFGYVLNDPNASLQAYELDPEATETINDLLDTLNEAATSLGLLGVISGQDFVPYSPFGDIDRSDEVVALFEFLELLNETLAEENVASAEETDSAFLSSGAPIALDDEGVTMQGNTITVDVLSNDVDPDPDAPLTLIFATLEPGFVGTVEFDRDAGTVTYDPGTAYDHLAEGESITVPITYAVSNGSGEFTSATVKVLVEGSNDTPAITLAGSDSSSAELVETDAPLTTSGTLSVFDIDLSDTVSASVVSVTLAGPDGAAAATGPAAAQPDVAALLSMMTVTSTVGPGVSDGQIVWHFNSGLHTFDYLSVGETETYTYTLQASDGRLSASQDVEITVTGTNDDPEVSGPVLATADEDDAGPATVNLLANASDPDLSDEIAVDTDSVGYAVTSGTWTDPVVHSVNGQTGTLSLDPQQFNSLGASESVELTFSYNVVDGNGGLTAATAVVTVTGGNDGPTAHADAATTDEDGPVSFSVLANDTDPDASDILTVTGAAVSSGQGSVAVGPNGSITYDPGQHYQHLAVGESATVEISYDIADGHGGTSSALATVTVTGVNDAPTAQADAASTDEDSAVSIDVLANDTDPDASDTLTVTGASVTSGAGTVTVGADDIITYDPGQAYQHLAAGESATVEITHQITDGHGGSSSAVTTVTVTGVNDAPTAAGDEAATDEDSAVSINVLANDTDPDTSDTLKVTGAGVTSGQGSVVVAPGGASIVYDPGQAYQHLAAGESATVEITYQIADGHGGTSSALATVTVTGVNDDPTAVDDSVTTNEDTAVTFDVVADDPDASDTFTVISAIVTSGDGTATVAGDQSITYDPGQAYQHLAVGESATVEITYEIDDGQGGTSTAVATVTVDGVNDAPTAVADSATTNEDTAKTIDVLANDTDPDASDELTVTGASVTAGGGGVTVGDDGRITYDPGQAYQHLAAGESATVQITYHISDGHLGTSSAVATVKVNGVNDGPTARGDEAATDENSAVAIDVLANDTDPDASDELTVTRASVTSGGGSVTLAGNGILSYDPGQAYQHLAVNESATVTITYVIADGNGGSSTADATVMVNGVNDGPTAHDDEAATNEDSTVAIDVLANDTDPDDTDQPTVTGASVTSGGGIVTMGAGGILTYDPGQAYQHLAVDESATVTITYDIADGNGGTSTADATVTVTGVNDGPTADDDEATTDENSAVAIDVLANDTDPDDTDELTVTSASVAPGSGSVSIGADGIITYDPGQDFQHLAVDESATVEITYHIADDHLSTSSAVATVTVWGVNDGPTAHDDNATTDEDSAVAIDVLANDTDPDDTDELTVKTASVPSGSGSVSVGADGIITYDPGQDFQHLAVDEFAAVDITYHIADGNGGTSTATATVKVTGVNDIPTAVVDGASTDEDSAVSIDVLANDTDPDDTDELTVTAASVTSGGGTVDVEADNTITYNPGQAYQHLAEDEFALVEITYDIDDGNDGTSSAKAIVTVTGVNDGPTAQDDNASTDEDSAVAIDVLANDTDPDDTDELTVTSATVPAGSGSVSVGAEGIITYEPGEDFQHLAVDEFATVKITYHIDDGNGGTSTATATVKVTGVNDTPSAVVDSASTDEDTAVSIDVLANDTDPDDTDELTVTGASVTSGAGTVDVEADGTITYDPGQHYQHLGADNSATVTISYDIDDGNGGTSSADATVTVNGVNDAPGVSAEVSASASENAAGFNVDLLAGASDPDDGDTLNVTGLELVSGDPSGVTVSGNSLDIDPSAYNHLGAGETEVIRYSYQVADAAGAVVNQTATITIEGATDIVWHIEQSDNSATANDGIIVEGDGATYTIAFSGDGDGSSLHGGESATVRLQFDPGSTDSEDIDPAVGDDSTFWAAVFDALVAQGGTVDGDTVSIAIKDGDANVGVGTFDRSTGNLQVTADADQTIDVGLPLVSFDLAAALDNGGGFESALVNQSNNGWGVSPDTHLDDGEGLFIEFLPTDIDTFTFDIEGFTANGSASFTVVGVDADGKPVAIKSTSNNAGVVGSVEGDRVQFTATANSSQLHSFTIVFAAAAVETVKIIGDGGNLQLRSFTGEDTDSSTVIDVPSPVKSLDPQHEIVFQDDGVDVARMTAGTELPSAEPEDPEDFTISLVDVDQPGDVDDGLSATDSSVTTTIEDTGAPSSGSDPIVFDLGESGVELSASAAFDLNNDGDKQMLAWPGAEDGMLVMDLDGSGTIENGSEVFSPYFGEGGYADALEALESLDQNSDQVLNDDDAAFADLLVWIDGNSDGVSQPDELLGLADLGVVEIDLEAQQVAYTVDDQNVLAEGLFSYGDGSTGQYLAVELDEIAETTEATAADTDSTGTVFALDGLSFGDVIADYESGDVIDLTRLGFELATGQFTEAAAETYVRYISPQDDSGDDDPQGDAGDLFVDPTGSGDFVLAAHVGSAPNNVLVRLADEADAVQDVLIT